MNRIIFSIILLLFTGNLLFGQPDRIGAGLAFANELDFNGGETSIPGLFLKTWISVDKKKRAHIVPSVTAFSTYKYDNGVSLLKNNMFQGDLDGQYVVFHEKTVNLVAFGGLNYTYLNSTFELYNVHVGSTGSNAQDGAFGGNIGVALELRMADHWDFMVSGKYKFSKYPQFVISAGTAYFFKSRGRQYRR